MARILLCEAAPDVRQLLAVMLDRLRHEPTSIRPGEAALPEAELLVLEPAAPACLEPAREALRRRPTLPVVCVRPARVPDEAVHAGRAPQRGRHLIG